MGNHSARPLASRLFWALIAVLTVPVLGQTGGPDAAKPNVDVPATAPATINPPGDQAELRWVRSKQDEQRVLRLQLAIREFKPVAGDGPTIVLAGAVHIADKSFYQRLEETLTRENDLVLFEGVMPEGMGEEVVPEGPGADSRRVELSKDRVRLTAVMMERWLRSDQSHVVPPTLEDFASTLKKAGKGREAEFVAASTKDAWGNPLEFKPAADSKSFTIKSLGADAAPGGEGHATDISLADLPPLKPSEVGEEPGLQRRLAETFDLSFQLDEMSHAGEKWKNVDMSIDQVQQKLKEAGAESGALFTLLDGSSFPAKLASGVLGLIERIPGMAPRLKVMMVEMLANVDDDMLAAAGGPGMGDTAKLMKVIIDDRNQVVIDGLRKTIETNPGVKRIAVLYGAGHMPDLSERLTAQLGYKHASGRWLTAIRIDLDAAGIDESEMNMTRMMMAAQLNALKKSR